MLSTELVIPNEKMEFYFSEKPCTEQDKSERKGEDKCEGSMSSSNRERHGCLPACTQPSIFLSPPSVGLHLPYYYKSCYMNVL